MLTGSQRYQGKLKKMGYRIQYMVFDKRYRLQPDILVLPFWVHGRITFLGSFVWVGL